MPHHFLSTGSKWFKVTNPVSCSPFIKETNRTKMGLVTVKKAHNQSELWILKSKLEAAGIPCFVKNEFITQVMNYMPAFVAELQVMTEDVEEAQKLLRSTEEIR